MSGRRQGAARRGVVGAALVASLSACATAPAAPSPPAPLPKLAPSLARPAAAACTWTGTVGRRPKLALVPGGPAFARIGAPARITAVLPVSAQAPAPWLSVSVAGLKVRGWASAKRGALRQTRAFAIGGLGRVTARARLRLVSASPGTVRVALKPPLGLHPVAPLEATVPCDALGLPATRFATRAAVAVPKGAEEAVLPARTAVPLRVTPGGAVVATWRNRFTTYVQVVARRPDQARVVVRAWSLVITAWVPASALHRWAGTGGILGRGTTGTPDAAWHPVVRCKAPVPLLIHRPGARLARVGTVDPGTPILLLGRRGDAVSVGVGGLTTLGGAELRLPQAVVDRCTRLPDRGGGATP